MNYYRFGIGLLLSVFVLLAYELSINTYYSVQQNKEIANLALLYQDRVEHEFANRVKSLQSLTQVLRTLPHIGFAELEHHGKEMIDSSRGFKLIRFADPFTVDEYTLADSEIAGSPSSDVQYYLQPKYSKALQRALESGDIALQGPYKDSEGGSTAILWSPVFSERKYRGVLVATISVSNILEQIKSFAPFDSLIITIRDGSGERIYGEDKTEEADFNSLLSIADTGWYLGINLIDGYGGRYSLSRIITLFAATFFLSLLLYFFIVTDRGKVRLEKQGNELRKKIKKLEYTISEENKLLEKAQMALEKSEERYKALFENNPIQTIVVDNSCRIVMTNFTEEHWKGRRPVIGEKMFNDYGSDHDIDMFSELVDSIESGKSKLFADLRYKEQYLRVNIAPYSDGAIITAIDITASKKMFNRLYHSHKMEAIGTLVGGIAHDFNNILGIISGGLELVEEELQNQEELKENIREITEAASRLKDIVRQLMGFSMQRSSIKGPVILSEMIEDSVQHLVRPSIPSSVEILTSIQYDVPLVMADPQQVQQLLINLCVNSGQAIKGEHGVIKIELEEMLFHNPKKDEFRHVTPGHYVMLSVSDDGVGIPDDIQERIFDPYFTTFPLGQAGGMGLSIAHGIVKDHEAEIVLKSVKNKGTTISILFPPLIGQRPISH